jgi:hypothetical protein
MSSETLGLSLSDTRADPASSFSCFPVLETPRFRVLRKPLVFIVGGVFNCSIISEVEGVDWPKTMPVINTHAAKNVHWIVLIMIDTL